MRELRVHFRPEFLNRVDETVLFKPLTTNEISEIVELLVNDLRKRLDDRRLSLNLTDEAKQYIAREGYDPVYGARPLKRFLQRQVETKIGRAIIGGEIFDGARLSIDYQGEELKLQIENPISHK